MGGEGHPGPQPQTGVLPGSGPACRLQVHPGGSAGRVRGSEEGAAGERRRAGSSGRPGQAPVPAAAGEPLQRSHLTRACVSRDRSHFQGVLCAYYLSESSVVSSPVRGAILTTLTDQEAEAQRGQGTCSRSHSLEVAETGLQPRFLCPGRRQELVANAKNNAPGNIPPPPR